MLLISFQVQAQKIQLSHICQNYKLFYTLMNSNQEDLQESPSPALNFLFEAQTPQSEAISNDERRGQDYNEIYKELSCGIYQSSDAFMVEDQVDGEKNNDSDSYHSNSSEQEDKYSEIYSNKQEEKNDQLQQEMKSIQIKPNLSDVVQDQKQEQSSEQVKNHREENIEQQKVQIQYNQQSLSFKQPQEFQFAESMSHYEPVMQFAYPSLMEEYEQQKLEEKVQNQKLDKIYQQNQLNKQTNRICIEQANLNQKNSNGQVIQSSQIVQEKQQIRNFSQQNNLQKQQQKKIQKFEQTQQKEQFKQQEKKQEILVAQIQNEQRQNQQEVQYPKLQLNNEVKESDKYQEIYQEIHQQRRQQQKQDSQPAYHQQKTQIKDLVLNQIRCQQVISQTDQKMDKQQHQEIIKQNQQQRYQKMDQDQSKNFKIAQELPQIDDESLLFVKQQLQKFAKNKRKSKTSINITGYQKQYFLKVQTQLYQIQVHIQNKQYYIKRRFSDFSAFDQLIKIQYTGFILYPFPEKSIEILRKMSLSMGSQQQKIILAQKRLLQLQRYINFLFQHEHIAISFLLQIFIQQSTQIYQRQMANIQNISRSQQNDLQLGIVQKSYNSIKKLVRTNFTFLKSYFAPQDLAQKQKIQELKSRCRTKNQRYAQFQNKLQIFATRLQNLSLKIQRLSQIFKQNSQFSNLQSNIDSVLKFGSKISSSLTFYDKLLELIQDHILIDIRYYQQIFRNIKQLINYRRSLMDKVNSLESQHYSIGVRLQQKTKLFQEHFEGDWNNFCEQYQRNEAVLYRKFNILYKNHCFQMSKLWK